MTRLLLVGLLLLQGGLVAHAKPLQPYEDSKPLPSNNTPGPRRAAIVSASGSEASLGQVIRPRRVSPGAASAAATSDVVDETGVPKP